MMTLDVIFKKKKNGEILAIFPEIPVDMTGELCEGYSSISKKVTVDHRQLRSTSSRTATKEEYQELYDILNSLGYNLNVVSKLVSTYKRIRKARVHRELGG